jgi:undecaprenyl-diphosphatase
VNMEWVNWFKSREREMLITLNLKWRAPLLDQIMNRITHIGGATSTIGILLLLTLTTSLHWTGLLALALSHLVVHVLKKGFRRRRPYAIEQDIRFSNKPLHDCSFPSGHTAASFVMCVSVSLAFPWIASILIPVACLVGWSRIYLGYHYPADVAVGACIGTVAAILLV